MLSPKPSSANERNSKDDEFEIDNINHASNRGMNNKVFRSGRCFARVQIKKHPDGVPMKQSVTVYRIQTL